MTFAPTWRQGWTDPVTNGTTELRLKWDQRHGQAESPGQPARVLAENRHLLPAAGEALDLACGLGANALLLAEAGLQVTAWDLSPVAVQRLSELARERGLTGLRAEVRDLLAAPPMASSFDVIVCSHFLERALMPALATALRPCGVLFYQTFSQTRITGVGPSNPAFRLADNELLRLLPQLRLRFYREEASLGDLGVGCRDLAMLVGERPR